MGHNSTLPAIAAPAAQSPGDFRLRTVSSFVTEAQVALPGARVAVCRYSWDAALAPTTFCSDAHYLDFALLHRGAAFQVGYLGRTHRDVFAASGDCCFIPAGHEMLVRCPQGEQRALVCRLDPHSFRGNFDWQWTALDLAHCFDISHAQIRAGLARIAEEVLCPGFAADLVIDSVLATLVVDLQRHFRASRELAPRSGGLTSRQRHLLEEVVHSTAHHKLTVEALASHCGLSGRHLSRLFRNETGTTLGDFVAQVRISRAKRRLADRDALIKEIAFECGFRSQSAFAHAFRRATGQTPQHFRQNCAH